MCPCMHGRHAYMQADVVDLSTVQYVWPWAPCRAALSYSDSSILGTPSAVTHA